MLIAIDIGNSSVCIGLFSEEGLMGSFNIPVSVPKSVNSWREEIDNYLSEMQSNRSLDGIIISSVVPELTETLSNSLMGLSSTDPMILTASLNTGLSLDVPIPGEIGTDRIATAVAANALYGSPVLVADFGTATTISAVIGKSFIGGAILPGLELMAESLMSGTSRLPLVEINSLRDQGFLISAVGKGTNKGIISGIIYGTAGGVERIIEETEKEEGCAFKIAITGGYSGIMTRYLRREHSLDPDLTLKGLKLIYERCVDA